MWAALQVARRLRPRAAAHTAALALAPRTLSSTPPLPRPQRAENDADEATKDEPRASSPAPAPAAAPLLQRALEVLPGLGASAGVMAAGFAAAEAAGPLLLSGAEGGPSPVSGIPVAILLGLAVRNAPLPLPDALKPGVELAKGTLLRAGA